MKSDSSGTTSPPTTEPESGTPPADAAPNPRAIVLRGWKIALAMHGCIALVFFCAGFFPAAMDAFTQGGEGASMLFRIYYPFWWGFEMLVMGLILGLAAWRFMGAILLLVLAGTCLERLFVRRR